MLYYNKPQSLSVFNHSWSHTLCRYLSYVQLAYP
ncbi:Uncharacterised protein [Vibrio cholerae]|nr:Uncharacterised protein [Vibrio cholerae]CSI50559.1 Uncharacterised protein [Vibrio cholerae]CSI72605.1 Uncharacterised protein [Vibrio cholerae]